MTDLVEPGGGEDAAAADMELSPGDVLPGLRDHRVALERSRAALSREVDRGACKRAADAAPPETRAGGDSAHPQLLGDVPGIAAEHGVAEEADPHGPDTGGPIESDVRRELAAMDGLVQCRQVWERKSVGASSSCSSRTSIPSLARWRTAPQ
jgi:hypothetical protein